MGSDRLEEISEVKRRLHRHLTNLSAAVQQKMDQVGMDKKTLQTRIGRSESFVERFFGGGVDVTMRTIAEMETALDMDLIEILFEPPTAPKRKET